MNRRIFIASGLVVIVTVVCFIVFQKKKSTPSVITTTGYTLAAISSHNSAASCWTAVAGNVYDLTSYLNQHPGGKAKIMSICGKDGTNAFEYQHGDQPRVKNELTGFLIGTLQ